MNCLERSEGRNTAAGTSSEKAVRYVHELFEAQAALAPDAIAITCESEALTYAQLNARANQIGHWLQGCGVEPEHLVAVFLERSTDAVVAQLGVLKAGAAYIPLDPAFPQERLRQILKDSQPEVIITQPSLSGMVSSYRKHVLLMGTPELASLSAEKVDSDLLPHNLAYVIFTSGSTGRPKGVQIEHRSLVNFLGSMAQEPGLTAEDILLAVTTFSFDIAGLEVFLPLIQGARVVIAGRDIATDGMALRRLLESSNANVMQATPITWRMLLESGWQGGENLKALCGGEGMPPDLARELIGRCSSLWNLYGPTETTIWSTIARVESAETPVPIGKPINNTQVYIVDRDLQPVRFGEAGELLIGGDGLARGYLNRPEFTAERFIPNPFTADKAARLYKTGDVCRWRSDGLIECLGRNDRQVKIRGYRIELGEVEAALRSHPAVKQAATKVVDRAGGEKDLVAYVVCNGGEPGSLRSYMANRLPDYMLPSTYVRLPELPLTPNRKVDWNALPNPDHIGSNETDTLPRTAVEEKISRVVANLLGLERVRAEDNFFEIGGHSLFCTQLVSRLRDHFGVELPVRSIFEWPTSAQLARQIEIVTVNRMGDTSSDEVPRALEQVSSGGGQG